MVSITDTTRQPRATESNSRCRIVPIPECSASHSMPNADPIGDTEDRLPYEPRYRSLDLWRGVACLMVLVFHSSLYQLAQLKRLHGFGLCVVTEVRSEEHTSELQSPK